MFFGCNLSGVYQTFTRYRCLRVFLKYLWLELEQSTDFKTRIRAIRQGGPDSMINRYFEELLSNVALPARCFERV
jgi:hypothetical protein